MPQEATELRERLESYRQTLGTLGMRDYQVRAAFFSFVSINGNGSQYCCEEEALRRCCRTVCGHGKSVDTGVAFLDQVWRTGTAILVRRGLRRPNCDFPHKATENDVHEARQLNLVPGDPPRAISSYLSIFLLKVRTLDRPKPLKATYTVIHMFVVLLLASVPSFILNLPVGVVAR